MKRPNIISFTASAIALAVWACASSSPVTETSLPDYARYVDPLIGTDFTGNTYPGAQVPFGMVQLSPDNGLPGWDRIAGYFYPDSTIAGFSHTHLSGTGAGDLYDISFMPVTLPAREAPAPLGIHSRFSHDREKATAGYYAVTLDDYGIDVELTATERCGIQRYTFPGGEAAVVLNLAKATNWDATLDTRIVATDSNTVEGYRFSNGWARDQRLWYCSRFSRAWDRMELVSAPIIGEKGDTLGSADVAWFYFSTHTGEQITVSTALSCTGAEGARLNLATEAPDDDFDARRSDARRMWNKELAKIEVNGPDSLDMVKFYTAMYHSMLAPTIYCDVDGAYRGPDKQVHQADGWTNYSTFSLWDTFRAAHPLMTYTQSQRTADFVKSFIAFSRQNGRLPVWNFQGSETDMMIGNHAIAVIADACLKGLVDEATAREALESCIATSNLDSYRQIGLYRRLGYVPCDVPDSCNTENWSLSKTLEYAFDDWCVARLAEHLGETAVAEEFDRRAGNYRNVFNPATGFMQPRDSHGNFLADFDPADYTPEICESNGWQYLWSVQHDIDGLVELMGGSEAFSARLDSMMTRNPGIDDSLPIFSTGMIGQYAHGNEPSHHVAYLHNRIGHPELTQMYVSRIMNELYTTTPAGLCGNEDCGQMSAWLVMSAMGFYPVNPASGVYDIGTPMFDKAKLHLSNGKTFTVKAVNRSKDNIFVKSKTLDGQPLDGWQITHDDIMNGATLELHMADK